MVQPRLTCRLVVGILLLFITSYLSGQMMLDFESLSIEDGFSRKKANAIIQDKKGFIWVGTWNGLNRYDGYNIKIYKPEFHDTNTFSNREILALLEDHDGMIWIGTTSGLNRLDPRTDIITQYDFNSRILSICEDSDHNIWVGTWNTGLTRLDPLTGERQSYLTNNVISDIHIDSRNMFWLATYNGLINFDPKTSGYISFLPDPENPESSISNSTVTSIAESTDGVLWVGTWGGGVNRVVVPQNLDSIHFTHYMVRDGEGSLSSNAINRLYYDQLNNLWLGTWDQGLSLLSSHEQEESPGQATFLNFRHNINNSSSLSGNNVSAIYVDRSYTLWVGARAIDRTNILNTGITRINCRNLDDVNSAVNVVRSLYQSDNHLWVGTDEDLRLYKNANFNKPFLRESINKFIFTGNGVRYIPKSILSILEDNNGLWLGLDGSGIAFIEQSFSEDIGIPIFFNDITTPALPGRKVTHIVKSKKYADTYWIGTMQSGFVKMIYNDGEISFDTYPSGPHNKAISDLNIRAITEDSEGFVWIGTQHGLNRFNPSDTTFLQFFYDNQDIRSVNDNVINTIYEDKSKNLWIGSNTGLNKVIDSDNNDISFQSFPQEEYLCDEIVTNIMEDDSSHLWIVLYSGIIEFDAGSNIIEEKYFTKFIHGLNIGQNTATKSNDGRFLLGGDNEFITFQLDSIYTFAPPPSVTITDFKVFNKSYFEIQAEGKERQDSKTIPYLDQVRLSYKDKLINIEFSAMDFNSPHNNEYSYLLEGFDQSWIDAGKRNYATYTRIRPGKYLFKVKAKNNYGVWSEKPAELAIIFRPPFWNTTVAYILYIIIFLLLLYFFKEYSIIKAKEKGRIQLEQMLYEKEHELNELKLSFFTNITHEFRTPLTLILGPAEALINSSDVTKAGAKHLHNIKRNAEKLLKLVNQLMEFRKVEKGKMEVYLNRTDVTLILNDLYESFKGIAGTKGIDIHMSIQHKQLWAVIDAEKIERVMFNLLSNAFKFTEPGGKIIIRADIKSTEDHKDQLILEVEDSGIGIAKEYHERIFERFYQIHKKASQSMGGIGLFLCKAFVELHNGTIEVDSEPGTGSCFSIRLPLIQNGYQSENVDLKSTDKPDADLTTEGILKDAVILSTDDRAINARNILIVEDDTELNEFIVSGLSANYKVTGTFNGIEGIEYARKYNPDIIISDIMMPEMDGIEFCKQLRTDLTTSHIPVIFLTAKTMKEDELEGLSIGAIDYITKPFSMVTLDLKIKNILKNREAIQLKIRTNQLLEPETEELSSLDEQFLKEAVDAVNNNLDDSEFDVDKFSRIIGISSNQAYRKIKSLTGQTAKEFIRNQRLKSAAKLLVQNKRSISEIIYMVGFSSPSYFTRCFKEYYGCTPKEYIEQKSGV